MQTAHLIRLRDVVENRMVRFKMLPRIDLLFRERLESGAAGVNQETSSIFLISRRSRLISLSADLRASSLNLKEVCSGLFSLTFF